MGSPVARHDVTFSQQITGLGWDTPGALSLPIPRMTIPLSGFRSSVGLDTIVLPITKAIVRFHTDDAGVFSMGILSNAQDMALDKAVILDGATLDNGSINPMAVRESGISGRIHPPFVFQFSDAVTTALDALTGTLTTIDADITYRYPDAHPYMGLEHFLEFHDVPPNTDDSSSVRLPELYEQIRYAPARHVLGTTTGGTEVAVEDCNFAALVPNGAVYVRPEDIGNNAEQIPADRGTNTAEKFRFHPGVFIRRANYYRGLTRPMSDNSDLDDTNEFGPIEIISVTTPITSSNWLVVHDGRSFLLRLDHPSGSDIRRPRDIWNQVWVPLLAGSQAIEQAVRFAGPNAATGDVTGIMSVLRYANYFRCLPIPGTPINQGSPG